MGIFDWFTQPGPAKPGAKFQHTDAMTEGYECNDRTDYPPEQPRPRRCVGTCTPDRQPMTHAGQVLNAVSVLDGLIDWNRLGPRDEYAEDINTSAVDRRRAGQAAHDEQQALIAASKAREEERAALLGQLSDTERGIYFTHLEANALQPGSDTLTPMGLGRDASGQVARARELQPVESKRRLR